MISIHSVLWGGGAVLGLLFGAEVIGDPMYYWPAVLSSMVLLATMSIVHGGWIPPSMMVAQIILWVGISLFVSNPGAVLAGAAIAMPILLMPIVLFLAGSFAKSKLIGYQWRLYSTSGFCGLMVVSTFLLVQTVPLTAMQCFILCGFSLLFCISAIYHCIEFDPFYAYQPLWHKACGERPEINGRVCALMRSGTICVVGDVNWAVNASDPVAWYVSESEIRQAGYRVYDAYHFKKVREDE